MQLIVQANNKEIISNSHYWLFVGSQFTGGLPFKGSAIRKLFPCLYVSMAIISIDIFQICQQSILLSSALYAVLHNNVRISVARDLTIVISLDVYPALLIIKTRYDKSIS